MTGDLEADDFKIIKTDNEKKTSILEARLADLSVNKENIEPILDKAIKVLSGLDVFYADAESDVELRRRIISSIFPEKLTFDGFEYRTARLNEAHIYHRLLLAFALNDFLALASN